MQTLLLLLIWLAPVVALAAWGATEFSGRTRTPDPPGGRSSPSPSAPKTSPHKPPSIERSPTNSTVSITVQAEPDPPLVYSVEPVNGSERLLKLTVVYVPLLDVLEFPTPRSADSDWNWRPALSPDSPEWADHIRKMQGAYAQAIPPRPAGRPGDPHAR